MYHYTNIVFNRQNCNMTPFDLINNTGSYVQDICHQIGEFAYWALKTEVLLSPKPGLVDSLDTGSHKDLTVELMLRSARTLMPFFCEMAKVGKEYRYTDYILLRENIGHIGRLAEKAMMLETNNVNTHRGAIWALGLLVTSAGILSNSNNINASSLCHLAGCLASLPDKYAPKISSKGSLMKYRYKINGAKEEAQSGFLSISQHALVELRKSRERGDSETVSQLNALLSLMIYLDDTCILSRSGMSGLNVIKNEVREILKIGGASSSLGMYKLTILNEKMIRMNASPGGAADLLAATLLIDVLDSKVFNNKNINID